MAGVQPTTPGLAQVMAAERARRKVNLPPRDALISRARAVRESAGDAHDLADKHYDTAMNNLVAAMERAAAEGHDDVEIYTGRLFLYPAIRDGPRPSQKASGEECRYMATLLAVGIMSASGGEGYRAEARDGARIYVTWAPEPGNKA